MNAAHLHLALTHVPVLGSLFGLLLLAFAMARRSVDVKKAALGVLVLSALVAVPVYLTGEPAEDLVQARPGFSHPAVERHEDAAAVAFTGILVVGAAALAGLVWFRGARPLPNWFAAVILVGSVACAGMLLWTANLGGQVRHDEIRGGGPTLTAER